MEYKQKTLFDKITERWEDVDSVYERLNNAREDIAAFFRPDLGIDYDEDNDMLMLGGDIYEGSGPWVARTASTAFQGNTVSKKLDWFKYGFSDMRVQGIDELDEFCQNMKEHNAAVYQRGNFYETQPQFTLDGWTIGSPLVFIEEDPDTGFIMSIPYHYLTYRIYYDRFNKSYGVIIKDKEWTARKCFDKFCPGGTIEERIKKCEKIFSLPLQNSIKQGKMNDKYTIWRAVFKASDEIWDGYEKPLGGKAWYDVYFEDGGPFQDKNIPILNNGYYSKPFVHWDYNKKLWETASRTPAFEAIFDACSINQIFKAYLEHLQQKVRPSMAALAAMQGRLKLNPGEMNYFTTNEWNFRPEAINQVGDITFESETVQMFRENLNRHFHLEMFRMFTNLAENTKQEFRVLQLAEMAGERITQLLPTIESHEGYLAQVDERVRDIERQAGRGPFNRMDLENVYDILNYYMGNDAGNAVIRPEFIGTLRQTQQIQQKLKPLQYGIGALSEFAQAMGDPNLVRFMIKSYEVGDEALQGVNFPQKLVREKADYDRLVESFNQSQQQNEQFAKMVELMKASKNLQGSVEPNSVMGMLAGAK
jgi:hypothetical protein